MERERTHLWTSRDRKWRSWLLKGGQGGCPPAPPRTSHANSSEAGGEERAMLGGGGEKMDGGEGGERRWEGRGRVVEEIGRGERSRGKGADGRRREPEGRCADERQTGERDKWLSLADVSGQRAGTGVDGARRARRTRGAGRREGEEGGTRERRTRSVRVVFAPQLLLVQDVPQASGLRPSASASQQCMIVLIHVRDKTTRTDRILSSQAPACPRPTAFSNRALFLKRRNLVGTLSPHLFLQPPPSFSCLHKCPHQHHRANC